MIITFLGHGGLFLNAAGKALLIDPLFDARFPYDRGDLLPPPDFVLLSGFFTHEPSLAQLRPAPRVTTSGELSPGLRVDFSGHALRLAADGVVLLVGGGVGDARADLALLPCDTFVIDSTRLQPREAAPFRELGAQVTPAQALAAAMQRSTDTHLSLLSPGDQWSPDTGVLTFAAR